MWCFVDQTGLDEITLSIPIVQLIITFLWPAISSTRGNRLKNIHYRPIKLMAPLSSKVIMQLICSIRANHPNWTQYKSGRTGHHYRLPTLNHQPWFLSKIPEPRVTIRLESIYSLHCNKKSEARAVVVAQLVERSLPAPEIGCSNPNFGKKLSVNCLLQKRQKQRKKRPG